jgi:hypothetical protein
MTAHWGAAFFAHDGTLDLRYHPGALNVELHLGGKRYTTVVSRIGRTRRLEVERIKSEEELAEEKAENDPSQPSSRVFVNPNKMKPFELPKLPGWETPEGKKKKSSVVEVVPPTKKPKGGGKQTQPKTPAEQDAGGGAK